MRREPELCGTAQVYDHVRRAEGSVGGGGWGWGETPVLKECVGVAGKTTFTTLRY